MIVASCNICFVPPASAMPPKLLFASVSAAVGANEIASLEGMQVASEEGMRVTDHLSLLTNFTTGGLYDDWTIYVLDAQIFGLSPNSKNLPPPRSEPTGLPMAAT